MQRPDRRVVPADGGLRGGARRGKRSAAGQMCVVISWSRASSATRRCRGACLACAREDGVQLRANRQRADGASCWPEAATCAVTIAVSGTPGLLNSIRAAPTANRKPFMGIFCFNEMLHEPLARARAIACDVSGAIAAAASSEALRLQRKIGMDELQSTVRGIAARSPCWRPPRPAAGLASLKKGGEGRAALARLQ